MPSWFFFSNQVFRKLRIKGVRPTIQTYNLLLRSVRDCGAGESPNAGQELMESLTSREAAIPKRFVKNRPAKALTSGATVALPTGRSRDDVPTLMPLESSGREELTDVVGPDAEEDESGSFASNAETDELERHAAALMESLSLGEARKPAVPFDVLGRSLVTTESLHDVVGISRLDKAEDRWASYLLAMDMSSSLTNSFANE